MDSRTLPSLMLHQQVAADWLKAKPRRYLGDPPGRGKTRALVAAVADARRPLVICPASVRTHWKREFLEVLGRFEHAIVLSYEGVVAGGDVLMAKLIGVDKVDALILDEAHRLRHAAAQRTVRILGRDGYARRIERVYPASGSPIPRSPADLYTLLASLWPAYMADNGFRSYYDFRGHFCDVRKFYVERAHRAVEKITGVRNATDLHALLEPLLLARAQVGPKVWYQELTLDCGSLPADVDWPPSLQALLASGNALAHLELDPSVSRIRHAIGDLKAPAVVRLLREQMEEGSEQVVVMAYHRSVLTTLREGLASLGVAYVDGSTSGAGRDEAIDRFQTSPACRIFLGQSEACKEGITLTAATRLINVEPSWLASDNEQVARRIARIGQKADQVVVQFVSLAGSLDESITRQCVRETRMIESSMAGLTRAA